MRTACFAMAFFALFQTVGQAQIQNQIPIKPPPEGIPVVDGGYYALGTVFANGKAYPAGTVVETNPPIVTSGVIYSTPIYGATYYPNNSVVWGSYPYYGSLGLGIGYSNLGFGYGGYYGNYWGGRPPYYGGGYRGPPLNYGGGRPPVYMGGGSHPPGPPSGGARPPGPPPGGGRHR